MATSSAVRVTLIGLAAALVAALLLVVSPGRAQAADSSGTITVRRQGSANYGTSAGVTVPAGGSATYSVRIRNTGTDVDQFRVSHGTDFEDFIVTRTLLRGRTDITALAARPGGYVTPDLAPGKSLVLTLVVSAADDATPGFESLATARLLLKTESGTGLNVAIASTRLEVSTGTTAWDGFIRAGNGRFSRAATGDSRKTGQSNTFTLRLQNDSAAPSTIGVDVDVANTTNCPTWPITVRDGYRDVTAPVNGGFYVTPTLQPGAHHDLKIKITSAGNLDDNANTTCTKQFNYRVLQGQSGPFNTGEAFLTSQAQP